MGSHTDYQKPNKASLHELSLYLVERDKLPRSGGKNGRQKNDISLSICPFSHWLQREPIHITLTSQKRLSVIIPVGNTT